MRMECSNCGHEAKVERGSYQFAESGLSNVVLQGIELVRCDECGNEDPIIPRVNDLMRALALAVIGQPYRLRGEDVRFLRKYLKMTGVELSQLLHVDKTTLSKWETNDDKIGEQSDRLIRAVALALGDGLEEKLEEIIRRFPQISSSHQRVRINLDAQNLSYAYA